MRGVAAAARQMLPAAVFNQTLSVWAAQCVVYKCKYVMCPGMTNELMTKAGIMSCGDQSRCGDVYQRITRTQDLGESSHVVTSELPTLAGCCLLCT